MDLFIVKKRFVVNVAINVSKSYSERFTNPIKALDELCKPAEIIYIRCSK